MLFNTSTLLQQLQQQVDGIRKTVVAEFEPLAHSHLLQAPSPGKWSVMQCLEHLNCYGRFYLPEMEKAINKKEGQSKASEHFKSGWLGNYFTKTMQPKPDGELVMRMQAPRAYRPVSSLPAKDVLEEFITNQQRIEQLLQRAAQVNLQQLKVPTTLGRWLKFSLGDTFRFVIAHEERHVLQAQKALHTVMYEKVGML